LDPPDLFDISSVLEVSFLLPGGPTQIRQLTLPTSSESLTQLFPLILLSLITMFNGAEDWDGSDAFWKSFVRNVPIPNDATLSASALNPLV